MTERTIREMVLEEITLTHVFEKYGIDYCCGGDMTLADACQKKGLDASRLSLEIESVLISKPYASLHTELWPLDFLVDYIIENHHRFIRETAPVIQTQLQKVAMKHPERFPFVHQVLHLFTALATELDEHCRKEEVMLFPYIKALVRSKAATRSDDFTPLTSVGSPIARMENEHQQVGQLLKKIRALAGNYSIPNGACSTQRASINGLEQFEKDLHQHIHLENNVLFPRALALEQQRQTH